jgi:UDP-D-galactose:(glucosyl)LPS alpha-1,6-D-galactosyltransferase
MSGGIIDILVPMAGRGGVEKVINDVSEKLLAGGYRVRVIQMVSDGFKWLCEGVEFYPILTGGKKVGRVEEFVGLYASFLAVHGVPSLVVATPWPFMAYVARGALRTLDFHDTVSVNNADNTNNTQDIHSGLKIISWLHAPVEIYKKYGTGGIECLSFADSVFVLNNRAKNQILSAIPDINVEIVANPVDMSGVKPVTQWRRTSRKLKFVGRISQEKRLDVVIRALALTRERWTLDVCGVGDEENVWRELAETVGVADLITWEGWKDNPWEDYEDVTALVVSSDYESFCLAAVEALARGIPVISTPVDGITEYVKPGVNGYFYEKGSSEGLAEVLDAVSAGILPDIQPEACASSVAKYERETVLCDIAAKIEKLLD